MSAGGGVTPSPHVENTLDSPVTDPGGRRRRRWYRDICGVLPAVTEFYGMTIIEVPGKGKQSRESQRQLHV